MPFCCFGKDKADKRPVEFDVKNFCDTVYYIGRPYRHRAIELIKICQLFSTTSGQSFNQDTELLSVIEICDQAISCAINSRSGKVKSEESDHKFEEAIRYLCDYESKFHHRPEVPSGTVGERMRVATENDERDRNKSRDGSRDDALKVVKFHILDSLPCDKPVIAQQALRDDADTTDLPVILWNFSHFKDNRRLTLVQNPHFYGNLPNSPDAYEGTFEGRCIDNCLPEKIFVPTNSSRRVYFNFPRYRRVFDVWKARSTLIFKDNHGNLAGESTVQSSLGPPPRTFRYTKNTQGLADEVGDTDDWRGLIHATDDTTHTRICVSAATSST